MAKVKYYKITSSQLSSLPIVEGQIIFVVDTEQMYIDTDATTRAQVKGIGSKYGLSISGNTVSLVEGGTTSNINIPSDTNTTYTFKQDANDKHKIIITPSTGTATTLVIPDNDTTYDVSTTEKDGLMSKSDKTKLTNIATNATKVEVGSVNGSIKINGTETQIYTKPELTKSEITTALGFTPLSTDNNTTYTISQDKTDGHKFTLKGSDGTETTITIPDNNTTYTFSNGLSANETVVSNSGVRSISTGDNDGTIKVNTNGTNTNVAVKGLSDLAFISKGTGTTKFLREDGTWQADNNTNTTYTFATGDANGQIKITPSGGSAQNVSVKGLGALAYKASLSASDVGALATSLKGAKNGLAELDADGKVPSSQLPSYVDDVLEYNGKANFPTTGEAGKIYVDTSTNLTYRWSGTAYIEISASLALGTTSATAYRGDLGAAAYAHAVTNKGSAFANGLYKITVNAEGHVTAATAVTKADITALGIPGSDTNTWTKVSKDADGYVTKLPNNTTSFLRGDGSWATPNYPTTLKNPNALSLQVSGTTKVSYDGSTSGQTFNIATGSSNGTIAVAGTDVSIKGLAAAAYKGVDTSATISSTSTNIPTTAAITSLLTTQLSWKTV